MSASVSAEEQELEGDSPLLDEEELALHGSGSASEEYPVEEIDDTLGESKR